MKRLKVIVAIVIVLILIVFVVSVMNSSVENEKLDFIGDKVEELAFQRVENEMKKQLKNPNSLSVNNVEKSYMIINDNGKAEFYNTQEELKNALAKIENKAEYTICYKIDYSAQNGFGGMNRDILTAQITLYNKGNQINSNTPYIKFNEQ